MIANFDQIKKQLSELVDIVNAFKSEQVQLRIIERLLSGVSQGANREPLDGNQGAGGGASGGSRPARKKKKKTEGAGSPRAGGGKAVKASIETLIAEGYFSTRRQVGEIVRHLSTKKAINLRPTAVATALSRLVQNGTVQRDKNSDEQFEYHVE